jgi:hypothetical protein
MPPKTWTGAPEVLSGAVLAARFELKPNNKYFAWTLSSRMGTAKTQLAKLLKTNSKVKTLFKNLQELSSCFAFKKSDWFVCSKEIGMLKGLQGKALQAFSKQFTTDLVAFCNTAVDIPISDDVDAEAFNDEEEGEEDEKEEQEDEEGGEEEEATEDEELQAAAEPADVPQQDSQTPKDRNNL